MSLSSKLTKFVGSVAGWVLILIGSISVAYAFAELVLLYQGVVPGEPIYLDELAPTYPELFRMLIISFVLLLAGIGIRYVSANEE